MRVYWLGVLLLASCNADPGGSGDARDMASPDEGAGGKDDFAVAAPCANGIKDVRETDVDCGGLDCALCADQKACLGHYDCQSQRCIQGRCVSCGNGVLDGGESDVDCGGG